MNTGNSNRLVRALRDGSCGVGGIHCPCCNNLAGGVNRTAFSRRVRARTKRFLARDLQQNPF